MVMIRVAGVGQSVPGDIFKEEFLGSSNSLKFKSQRNRAFAGTSGFYFLLCGSIGGVSFTLESPGQSQVPRAPRTPLPPSRLRVQGMLMKMLPYGVDCWTRCGLQSPPHAPFFLIRFSPGRSADT